MHTTAGNPRGGGIMQALECGSRPKPTQMMKFYNKPNTDAQINTGKTGSLNEASGFISILAVISYYSLATVIIVGKWAKFTKDLRVISYNCM